MNILVVDDSIEHIEALKMAIDHTKNISISYTTSANEALNLMKTNKPDVLLTDIMFVGEEAIGDLKLIFDNYVLQTKLLCQELTRKGVRNGLIVYDKSLGHNASYDEELYRLEFGNASTNSNHNIISRQFALGLALALIACDMEIEPIVISTGHRHDHFMQLGGIIPLVFFKKRFPDCHDIISTTLFYERIGYDIDGDDYFPFYFLDAKKKETEFWIKIIRLVEKAAKNGFVLKDLLE